MCWKPLKKKSWTYSYKIGVVMDKSSMIQDINRGFSDARKPLNSLFDRTGTCGARDPGDGENDLFLRSLITGWLPFGVFRHGRIVRPRRCGTPVLIANDATQWSSKLWSHIYFDYIMTIIMSVWYILKFVSLLWDQNPNC